MNPELIIHFSAAISAATHRAFSLRSTTPIGGGSINQAYCLEGADGSRYFIKLNDGHHLPMFIAEVDGLNAIARTNTIRVPLPISQGCACGVSYLVLEYLELSSRGDAELLGEQLAVLHRCVCGKFSGKKFGFAQDGFIGTTPQQNGWEDDWIEFWRERRLGFQLRLAAENGYGGHLQDLGARLLEVLPSFFAGHTPQPSLLHGDLWNGNHAFFADGQPTIFDPAAYYGDRECDLAMTELFGGYSADFYAAYRAAYPLDAGYPVRRDLYNLYHILNHANLFGGGYARQAEQMMSKLLNECA